MSDNTTEITNNTTANDNITYSSEIHHTMATTHGLIPEYAILYLTDQSKGLQHSPLS